MEIKLITTNVTTSGGGIGFKFIGNVEIKKVPIIFGTTVSPKQTVNFNINYNNSNVTSNDENYFEIYSDKTVKRFSFSSPVLITSLDLSNFDTSQVKDMSYMFRGCSDLTSLDLSNFDTSQATNMRHMFKNCSGLTSLDLSKFDTSLVTNMSYMFGGCSGLTSLNISDFNTSQVTIMDGMFNGCTSLKTITINDEASANKLIAQIQTNLKKTATWDSTTKIITIPA